MASALFFASHNQDKVAELSSLVSLHQIAIHSMRDFPDLSATIEDGDSIFANAMKKAIEAAQYTQMISLADDTGLFIEALGGAPGINSARYAGEKCSYEDNVQKVLLEMRGFQNRNAYFETALALADTNGIIGVVSGLVRGSIAEKPRGENGFGYDNIFIVEGKSQSYAEMKDYEKNHISHRSLAFKEILPLLKRVLRIEDK